MTNHATAGDPPRSRRSIARGDALGHVGATVRRGLERAREVAIARGDAVPRKLIAWAITWQPTAAAEPVAMTFPAPTPELALETWRLQWDQDGAAILLRLERGGGPAQ